MRPLPLLLAVTCLGLAACQGRPDHLAPEDDLTDSAFELVDQDGEAYSFPSDAQGRPTVVAAVYTSCPDVCLMTMANLRRVKTLLGPDSSRVGFATVTFDPERDTPERLSTFADTWRLGGDWRMLTGEQAEVDRLMERLRIRTQFETPDTLSDGTLHYLVSHSDKALLLDATGQVVETYGGSSLLPEMVADDARALLD
jgi:protein SCO1/2